MSYAIQTEDAPFKRFLGYSAWLHIGLVAAVELEPLRESGQTRPGARALKVFERAMEDGMLFRFTGDIIAMAPPFISTQAEIGMMVEVLRGAIRATH